LYKKKIKELANELKAKPLFAYFHNNRIYIYILKEIKDVNNFNSLFDMQKYLDVYNRIFNTNQTIEIVPSKNPLLKVNDLVYMNEILVNAVLNYDAEIIEDNTFDIIDNKEAMSIDEFLKEIDNYIKEINYKNLIME